MCDLDTATNQCKMDGLSSSNCSTADVRLSMSILRRCSLHHDGAAIRLGQLHVSDQPGPQHACTSIHFWGNVRTQRRATIAPPYSSPSGRTSEGCLAPLNAVFKLISPQSAPKEFNLINNPLGTVCFNHDTMATLLDKSQPATQLEVLHSWRQ